MWLSAVQPWGATSWKTISFRKIMSHYQQNSGGACVGQIIQHYNDQFDNMNLFFDYIYCFFVCCDMLNWLALVFFCCKTSGFTSSLTCIRWNKFFCLTPEPAVYLQDLHVGPWFRYMLCHLVLIKIRPLVQILIKTLRFSKIANISDWITSKCIQDKKKIKLHVTTQN